MAARGDVEAMAMYGRRPRKILQNRVELLTYETVREALLVADQAAQSDEHRQFVIRMSQCARVLSDSGRRVLERIARCGEGHVRSTAEGRYKVERIRCEYPMCPTCGIKARDRVASKLRWIVEETTAAYGFDSVSFITVNAAPCRLNEVANKVNQFRTSLRNIMRRRCPQVSLIGEFEVIQEIEAMSCQVGIKGIEKISKVGEGLETTHPGIGMTWIRPHLHAMAVHPGLTRQKLRKVLRLVFSQQKAVRIEAIRDRVTAGGRWFNGTDRAAKYLCDKSSAVKGEQRTAIDLQKQMVAFDAYCRMTRGTRRRHGFSIGARELANFLRSLERARTERAEGQRRAFVERLRARGRAKWNEPLDPTLADSRL
jgi:hypothetical protein